MSLEDQLIRDEGLRLKPYTDTVGKLSVGIGRNLTDDGISKDEAMVLLQNDIATAKQFLADNLPWTLQLDEVRSATFIGLAFNMQHRLLGFRLMLEAAQKGDWQEASKQLLTSEWATQVGARAQRSALQLETGNWAT